MAEFLQIGDQRVEIPAHLDDAQRERFHRSHPGYVAPTAAAAPPAVREAGAGAVAAWVDARARLAPLTPTELAPPSPDPAPAPAAPAEPPAPAAPDEE